MAHGSHYPLPIDRLEARILRPSGLTRWSLQKVVLLEGNQLEHTIVLTAIVPSVHETLIYDFLDERLFAALQVLTTEWASGVEAGEDRVTIVVKEDYDIEHETIDEALGLAEGVLRAMMPYHQVHAIRADQTLILVENNWSDPMGSLRMRIEFPGSLEYVEGAERASAENLIRQLLVKYAQAGEGVAAQILEPKGMYRITVEIQHPIRAPSEALFAECAGLVHMGFSSQVHLPDHQLVFRSSRASERDVEVAVVDWDRLGSPPKNG